jgi:hypothetical protein
MQDITVLADFNDGSELIETSLLDACAANGENPITAARELQTVGRYWVSSQVCLLSMDRRWIGVEAAPLGALPAA